VATKQVTKRNRTYTPQQIDRALLELVVSGSSVAARKRLAAQGLVVSDRTLRDWRLRYPDRYAEIAERHAPEVERVIIQEARELAVLAAEVERKALERELEALDGQVKDASASARNAATVAGINLDKVLAYTGRPKAIVEYARLTTLFASCRPSRQGSSRSKPRSYRRRRRRRDRRRHSHRGSMVPINRPMRASP
jgi:hypothetical protein